jgi:UDP:flavonoid glycosyltransferase YjiC (YdhE family)
VQPEYGALAERLRDMRILFTTTRGAGHFGPLLPFANACVRAGHEVSVAGPAQVAALAERAVLPFRALPEPSGHELAAVWEPVFSLPPERQDEHVIREIFAGCHARAALPGTLATIEEWAPDVVVRESCEFSGAIAAERLGVPHAAVGVFLSARNDDLAAVAAAPVLAELRAGVGLGPDPGAWILRRAPLLTQAPRSLDDSSATAIGALRFREPRSGTVEPLPDWWAGSEAPLVYLSFGTEAPTMDFFPGVYLAAIGALAELPARVLVTIGDARDPAELGPLPPSVHVEQWVPQSAVMPHAAAMVGHGGSGSTLTALAWGVPMALVPLFADQGTNAERVAEAGAGVVLEGGPEAVSGLTDAVTGLLKNPSYRAGAARVRDEIAALAPVDDAVAVLAGLAGEQPRAALGAAPA